MNNLLRDNKHSKMVWLFKPHHNATEEPAPKFGQSQGMQAMDSGSRILQSTQTYFWLFAAAKTASEIFRTTGLRGSLPAVQH